MTGWTDLEALAARLDVRWGHVTPAFRRAVAHPPTLARMESHFDSCFACASEGYCQGLLRMFLPELDVRRIARIGEEPDDRPDFMELAMSRLSSAELSAEVARCEEAGATSGRWYGTALRLISKRREGMIGELKTEVER